MRPFGRYKYVGALGLGMRSEQEIRERAERLERLAEVFDDPVESYSALKDARMLRWALENDEN